MKKSIFYSGIIASILFMTGVTSCTHDPISIEEDIDTQLYQMALTTDGYSWYKNSDALLPKSSGTGHSNPFLRTRYNATASLFLDSNGMVIPGTEFLDGATIVKELISDDGDIERYAILFKDSDHTYADANGWVWGYINADGTIAAEAANQGAACINCHSQADNIDYGLMNKAFPL